MSELRQDILTGNWTVMAPERGKKPKKLKTIKSKDLRDYPEYDPVCPFCPGNELKYEIDPVVELLNDDDKWSTRVIENKYKIFDDFNTCPVQPEPFKKHGIYSYYQGCGNHFLVIEHNQHNRIMGEMEPEQVQRIFHCYLKTLKILQKNPNNLIVIMFKNQGIKAGGSQPHAHSQIVGSRVVPTWIRNALHVQEKYFDDQGHCAMCSLLNFELDYSKRIVVETEHTVVLSPYAAGTPYEMWIIPKRHLAWYGNITEQELSDFSASVLMVLRAYVKSLENPDFNYFVHSSPTPLKDIPYYHLFVQIVPRWQNKGGFETGTKIPVNSVLPEKAIEIF
jgi:UDPglucose--hexose-1-phosphate uridylyltransferase